MATKKSKKPVYYTYLIGWSWLNVRYYGSKYSRDADPELFWKKYWTSSKYVAEFRKQHGDPDVIQIRRQGFATPDSTRLWEHKVLRRLNAAKNPNMLNRSNGNKRLLVAGTAAAMIAATGRRLGLVSCDDPRWKSGEIKSPVKNAGHTRGKAPAICTLTGKRLGAVSCDDSRWTTGEIVAAAGAKKGVSPLNIIGKRPAKLRNGESVGWVDVSDARWTTGEIVCINQGVAAAVLTATGEFIGKVCRSDPRWHTGEIRGMNYGKKAAVLLVTGEKIGLVALSDCRWKTGEIVAIGGARCGRPGNDS